MSQLFEVLITLVGNQRYQSLMQPIVPELIYLTIGNSHALSFAMPAAVDSECADHRPQYRLHC